jgi:hypothetical protein
METVGAADLLDRSKLVRPRAAAEHDDVWADRRELEQPNLPHLLKSLPARPRLVLHGFSREGSSSSAARFNTCDVTSFFTSRCS